MKITAFLVLAVVLQTYANEAYSQKTRLSLDYSNTRLEVVLDDIENISEFYFLANEKLVDLDRNVNLSVENTQIDEILEMLFAGTDVVYTITDRKIILAPSFLSEDAQPQRSVSGTVTDAGGQPLPGVTVVVKGTTQGTVTDNNGTYTLANIPEDATLVFSFVGMHTQEVAVGGQTRIDARMEEESIGLEEVVAVGYGTQRRLNLTGSVSTVDKTEIKRKNVTQASQLMQGTTSGVTSRQSSGQPGSDGASLYIRGLGTFSGAGNEPLVLIDGVPGNINNVNPNNIESITVLKDAASASIYGSRAANGVIIVTTNTGVAGEMTVSYDAYMGQLKPTRLPEFVDSWVYAEMMNEMLINANQSPLYTQDEINLFQSGTDPDNYPNTHHLRDLFNSGSGLQTKHNLTFQGGTENTRYLVSGGYLLQNGNVEQNQYNRYDLLVNLNIKLKDNLLLDVQLTGYQSVRNEPAGMSSSADVSSMLGGIVSRAFHDNASIPGQKSDGSYALSMGHPNVNARLASGSFQDTKNTYLLPNLSLQWEVFKNFRWKNRASYSFSDSDNRLFGATHWINPEMTIGPSKANVTNSNSDRYLYESFINYDFKGENHVFAILGGFSVESANSVSLGAYRDDFPSNLIHHLSAASPANASNSETASTVKLESYFGRLNYSYKNKYLLEGNVRYDGSSRFDRDTRWGLFPSVSAGWRISEERFFQATWIDNFTIRGSYGILGNQAIGNYPYQRVLSLGSVYSFGDRINPGVQLTNTPFDGITWETTKITNAGIDLVLFKNKLSIVADYYHKKTEDILYQLSVSQVMGMTVGAQNAGAVENKGLEFILKYNVNLGDFSFSINPNFSINNNKVTDLANVERDIAQGLFIGKPLNSIYGYRNDGLFIDQADISDYATQNYPAKPGFPRYKDLSGPDGVPDGIVSSAHDREVIGTEFPKYVYGMGITANYKGFDFYMQLQGLGGYEMLIQGDELAVFNYGNMQQWQVDGRWTTENPDPNAIYPRFEMAFHSAPWNTPMDYWVRDASFLRINNLQIGYNIGSKLLGNTFIDQFRIYLNGDNLHSFDNYYPGWDPEMNTSGTTQITFYPVTKMWSVGVNIQF